MRVFHSLIVPVAVMTLLLSAVALPALPSVGTDRIYYPSPFVISDSVFEMTACGVGGVGETVIEVRAAIDGIGERRGLAPCYWGVRFISGCDTLSLSLRHGNSDFGDIFDRRQSILTLSRGDDVMERMDVDGFDTSSGTYNTLQVRLDPEEHRLSVSGGGRGVKSIFESEMPFSPKKIELWSRGELTVSSLVMERARQPQSVLATIWTAESLNARFRESSDPNEGFWRYLDRENDPQYARPGGRYLLAVVKNDNGEDYDIIYVDGAETFSSRWKTMMLKGRLRSTIFENHFDLEWIDATFEPIRRDIHASITGGSILTLSFPLLKTTLRFSKVVP